MDLLPLDIDADIRRARTLPAGFYGSADIHDLLVREVLPRTWQLVPVTHQLAAPGDAAPWTLLDGSLSEPLLAVRGAGGEVRVLSNVCTHRGNLLLEAPGRAADGFRCRYHGRRFDAGGRCLFMPGFEEVDDFPGPEDHLARLPTASWGPLHFTSLAPETDLAVILAPVRARLEPLLTVPLHLDPAATRSYQVEASWALYCDNYLEGFHIPFVHPALAGTLEEASYRTETYDLCSLQTGEAPAGQEAFDLPAGHPDAGRRVGGYYFFLFPNTMLNFYPWGVSVNILLPQGPDRARIDYLAYVADDTRRARGAGGDLHTVELEDEAVVESVARGVRSRIYRRGRYAPTREQAVHHFHRLLARHLNAAWERRGS